MGQTVEELQKSIVIKREKRVRELASNVPLVAFVLASINSELFPYK